MADRCVVGWITPLDPQPLVEGQARPHGMVIGKAPIGTHGDPEKQCLTGLLSGILRKRSDPPESDSDERLQIAPAEILLSRDRDTHVLEAERGQVGIYASVSPTKLEGQAHETDATGGDAETEHHVVVSGRRLGTGRQRCEGQQACGRRDQQKSDVSLPRNARGVGPIDRVWSRSKTHGARV